MSTLALAAAPLHSLIATLPAPPAQAGQPLAPAFRSWHTKEAIFIALAVLSVSSALLVVSVRNVVHAALWLVVALGALAGCYLVLTAEFVAWVQVLIYIGAVVVMLLFATMLTKAPLGESEELDTDNGVVAAFAGAATTSVLLFCLEDAFGRTFLNLDSLATTHGGGATSVGASVFRYWVLPFEVVSVLLLAAMVGAIVLVRRRGPGEDGPAAEATEAPSLERAGSA